MEKPDVCIYFSGKISVPSGHGFFEKTVLLNVFSFLFQEVPTKVERYKIVMSETYLLFDTGVWL